MKKVDFIIVGQGIAGTLLAHDLIEAKKSVAIIDTKLKSSSSTVASGLINTIGMKRCVPINNAQLYFSKAVARYKELEQKLDTKFLEIKPIIRLFSNNRVKHEWYIKFVNRDMDRYISCFHDKNKFSLIKDNYGSAEISTAAHLNFKTFLNFSRKYFNSHNLLIDERFDFSCFDPKSATYKSIKSDRVIFCEGFRVMYNPYFSFLPLTPTKGEVITIKIRSKINFNKIISSGIYLIPLGKNYYLAGSTYNHNDLTDIPSHEGKAFLINKVKNVLSVDFKLVSCVSGVRPTVKDRKNLIGLHPKFTKIGVFNGLGSRGGLQGPFLSAEFSSYLLTNRKTLQVIDNQRVKRFYCA